MADCKAVHVPDRHRAIIVVQHDVGLAVQVEIAGAGDMPVRPRLATTAEWLIWSPVISQMATLPLLFCNSTSVWLSSLKSPVPSICQFGQGLGPSRIGRSSNRLCPRRATVPLSFCNNASVWPSLQKFPVLSICHAGPGSATKPDNPSVGAALAKRRPRRLCLPEDIRGVAAKENAGAFFEAVRARVRAERAVV
jgi:hypothetical protein